MSSRPSFSFELSVVNRSRHTVHLCTEMRGGWMERPSLSLNSSNGVLVVSERLTQHWLWPGRLSTTVVVSAGGTVTWECQTTRPLRFLCRLRSCEPATVYEMHPTDIGQENVRYECSVQTPAMSTRMAWYDGQRTVISLKCDTHPDAVDCTTPSNTIKTNNSIH